jgi:lysophospholipid acyltransferase (LPLAT)-like uncharacterized protein
MKFSTRAKILTHLLGTSVALLRPTLRVEQLHSERYLDLQASRIPIIFSLWHGRMFLPIEVHRRQGIVTMASQSVDGDIVTYWLENNGYLVVRGSTAQGGSAALRGMVRHVRSGHDVALTVDGPKGPARVVQPGVVRLARLTGACILPVSSSSSWPLFLASWDRYLVPKPFSRNFVAYGEPISIGDNISDETALSKIRTAIEVATREADQAIDSARGRTRGEAERFTRDSAVNSVA